MKPTHWIVRITDKGTGKVSEHKFFQRARARGFAVVQKAQGHEVEIEAKGWGLVHKL